jgi:hypothetical protein
VLAVQKALSKEKFSWSTAEKALTEGRVAWEVIEHGLKKSSEELSRELEIVNTSLTTTCDKLASKSTALDAMVILRDDAKLLLPKSEEKLQATEEELKTQGQSLEMAWKALSRREISSNTMISLAVAHAATLFKDHLSDLDVEILHKDFTVDEVVRETTHMMSLKTLCLHMTLPVSSSPKTMIVPGTCDSSLYAILNTC